MAQTNGKQYDIPKTCKADVVVNADPNFTIEVQDVPVPEPGKFLYSGLLICLVPSSRAAHKLTPERSRRSSASPECHRSMLLRFALHDRRPAHAADGSIRCTISGA